MFVHEYQAKDLLSRFDLTFPAGNVALSILETSLIAFDLHAKNWVVKAQILAGDRGRFGGIKMAHSVAEVTDCANELFGSTLYTPQTGDEGQKVSSVYIEEALDIKQELYLSVLVDRFEGELILLASSQGGSGVESHLRENSENLHRVKLSVDEPLDENELMTVAKSMGLNSDLCSEYVKICREVYRAAIELDALMIELNPLAVTEDDQFSILDVKMELDDNSLFRHPEFEDFRTIDVDTHRKMRTYSGYNYVRLKGNVGLLVGGAGLALATMDMLHDHDCEPANFLDLPPVANRVDVESACYTILENKSIKALLVNVVGGGLTHCDTVAAGLITVQNRSPMPFPVIVRFAGTKMEHGITLLKNANMPFHLSDSMTDAVQQISRIVR